jgi:2-oxoisovalerate dehydrogenase E1 component alpha subunit
MPQWQTCRNVASTPTAEKWVFEQSDKALNHVANTNNRVLFPGALNSEFTNNLEFLRPSQNKAISTFRILDQYGQVLDKETGVDTTDEEALELYRHMVCCKTPLPHHAYLTGGLTALVNIMDLIMFEAQRQGRLSFYMVC